jgi:hypothetical protein
MNESKDNHYLTYIRWLISDPRERYPKTIPEFLTTYNLTNEDLTEYENKATYYQDLEREIKNWGISKLPEVMRGAYNAAKDGKASSVRAFKELLEDSKTKGNTINVFAINPTAQQYQKILDRENKRLAPTTFIDVTPNE